MQKRVYRGAGILFAGVILSSHACAGSTATGPYPKVWARSHNASEVDIYILCGDQNAKWVGVVPAKGAEAFELAREDTYCPWGLNFFLVVREQGRGYWAGPVRPGTRAAIELVIEKYAGLSSARVLRD
jgi:hypothetical protein